MTAALALLLAQAAGSRAALVVSLDAYAFTSARLPLDQRLSAAKNDLAAVSGMLDGAGFSKRVLLQGQATKAAIEKGLADLATGATSGSDVVFYFSGCGSTSLTAKAEPTLVPADGLEAKATMDVPMARVEEMARKATAKGAHVTVIVDACFAPAFAGRGLEARIYKPIVKCVGRKGSKVRAVLFEGPGVFLCPAQGAGATYEWRASSDPASWTSVFTDYVTGIATDAILTDRMPAVRPMMREADAYFKSRVRDAYLPGTNVALPAAAKDPAYDATFLTSGPLPPLKPEQRSQAERRKAALDARARSLSVGIEIDEGIKEPARRAALKSRIIGLKAPLEAKEGVKLVSAYDGRTDRVVTLSDKDGITLTVQGGDLTKTENATFSGADAAAAVAAGLDTYLERELLVKRLWNLVERGADSEGFRPQMARTTIAPGENLEIGFDARGGGYLYLLNRDDADGEVKLLFPYVYEFEPYFAGGGQKAPKYYKNVEGVTSGRSVLAAIFVPGAAGSLPPLPDYHAVKDAQGRNRAFEGRIVAHLRKLLEVMAANPSAYGVRRLEYTIP